MEKEYEKPLLKYVIAELRDTILGASGDDDPWNEN